MMLCCSEDKQYQQNCELNNELWFLSFFQLTDEATPK